LFSPALVGRKRIHKHAIPIHEMLDTNKLLAPPLVRGVGGSMCSALKVKWYYSLGTTNTGICRFGFDGDDGVGELGTPTDGVVESVPGLVKINSRSGADGGGGGLESGGRGLGGKERGGGLDSRATGADESVVR
jgi:hypothetical protein